MSSIIFSLKSTKMISSFGISISMTRTIKNNLPFQEVLYQLQMFFLPACYFEDSIVFEHVHAGANTYVFALRLYSSSCFVPSSYAVQLIQFFTSMVYSDVVYDDPPPLTYLLNWTYVSEFIMKVWKFIKYKQINWRHDCLTTLKATQTTCTIHI